MIIPILTNCNKKEHTQKVTLYYFLLFNLLFILPTSLTSANEPSKLSIKELQLLGMQANGLVRAARSQVGIAESGVISAEAYPNPEVSVTAGTDKGRLPDGGAGPLSTHRTVAVSQTIENPYLRSARIGSAQANVEASQAGLNQVRADLASKLRIRAYELLMRQEIARMETDIFEIMKEVRRRIKVSVDVGETARFVMIRAETEALSSANRKETALLTAQRARVALVKLTAGSLHPNFEINASLSDPVDFPPLEILRQAVINANPDILRLEAELEHARLKIDQERAAILPSVDISYSNFQYKQYTSNTAGLSVNIPLFYRRRGEIDSALFDLERIRETLEYRRFEAGQLVESAWQAMRIAKRRVEMFDGGIITEARLALTVAQTAYRLGESGFIDVLDTKRVLRDVLADLFQAQYELQSAAAEIDRLRAHYPKE